MWCCLPGRLQNLAEDSNQESRHLDHSNCRGATCHRNHSGTHARELHLRLSIRSEGILYSTARWLSSKQHWLSKHWLSSTGAVLRPPTPARHKMCDSTLMIQVRAGVLPVSSEALVGEQIGFLPTVVCVKGCLERLLPRVSSLEPNSVLAT